MSEARNPTITTTAEIGALPDGLESPRGKLVYLYLSTAGRSTLSELQTALEMKKITLLSVLDALDDRGLVDYDDGEYRRVV